MGVFRVGRHVCMCMHVGARNQPRVFLRRFQAFFFLKADFNKSTLSDLKTLNKAILSSEYFLVLFNKPMNSCSFAC